MPGALQTHAIFNCVVGADQTAVTKAASDSVLYFLGGNLTPAAAASLLTVFDGAAAGNVVLLTLGAPASGGTAPGNLPGSVPANSGTLHYTLTGAGATAQIYWMTG